MITDGVTTDSQSTTCVGKKRPSVAGKSTLFPLIPKMHNCKHIVQVLVLHSHLQPPLLPRKHILIPLVSPTLKEHYCSHDDSCLSGSTTATDSQTNPSPPATKKPCFLRGKYTPLSSNELLVAHVIMNVHIHVGSCARMYNWDVQQGGAM